MSEELIDFEQKDGCDVQSFSGAEIDALIKKYSPLSGNISISIQNMALTIAALSKQEAQEPSLDERMANAGMIPVSQMLERNALGKFSANAGVDSLESFEKWIQVERRQYIEQQAEMMLDEREDDELYEWVVAHNAVLGEVMANYRQAISNPQPTPQSEGAAFREASQLAMYLWERHWKEDAPDLS